MEDPEEDQRPLASRYSPKRFKAAFCLWYNKLDTKSQKELFSYGPEDFDLEWCEEAKVINYIARGVTEHLKYELGLPDDEQWIVLSWIRTYLDWELFRDARQIASTAIGHEELHEMTKRAVLMLPMADLQRPRSPCPMTMEKGVFLAKPPEASPGLSPTGSDSLSPLSSYSATPPPSKKGGNWRRKLSPATPGDQQPLRVKCKPTWIPPGQTDRCNRDGPFLDGLS